MDAATRRDSAGVSTEKAVAKAPVAAGNIEAAAVVAAGGDGAALNFDLREWRAVFGVATWVGDIYEFGARPSNHQISADVHNYGTYAARGERGVGRVAGDVALGEGIERDGGAIEMCRGLCHAVELPVWVADSVHRRVEFGAGRLTSFAFGVLPDANHDFRRGIERAVGALAPLIE